MNNFTASPPDVKDAYEELRNNVLGKTNCCRGLIVFLRRGMAAWLCLLQTQPAREPEEARTPIKSSAGFRERDALASKLAAVIADGMIAAHDFN